MATTPEGVTEERRGVSPAQIGAVIAGLLILFLLIWFLFLRGDEPEEATAVPAPVTGEAPEEEEEAAVPPTKSDPVETFEVFAPKDPFDPLVSAAAASGGGTTAPATGGTTTTPSTDGTTTTTGPDGTTTTTTTTSPGGSRDGDGSQSVGSHRVRVVDVFTGRRAQIQVDGTVYTVDEGERFADNFQLLSTSGQCASMLFGDDEFTLCEGEEILK